MLKSLYIKQYVFLVQMQSHVLAALFFRERYVWYFDSLHPAFEMSCDTEYLWKQLLIFSETWASSFCIVCNCFDDFRTNLPKNNGRSHRKENINFPEWRWLRSKNVCLSSALLFSLVVTKICFEVSLLRTIRVFCSSAESRFGCAIFRTLRSVLWLFTSCVWDVLRFRILRKKQLLIFSETWSSSFWIVCICFDDFRTSRPKNSGRPHRMENTNFPKQRWVRSKNVFLSSGGLDSLVIKKSCFENLLKSLYIKQYVFLVQMQSHVLAVLFSANATFGTSALHILRLRCLAIPNT